MKKAVRQNKITEYVIDRYTTEIFDSKLYNLTKLINAKLLSSLVVILP